MIKTLDGNPVEPVFDWYQATTKAEIRDLVQVLEPVTENEPFRDEKPKLKGYGWALKVGGPGGSVLIHYGGKNGDEYGPNVAGTGPMASAVADLLRGASIPHGVGRADVRLDFLGDFDLCRKIFIERCDQAGMSPWDRGSCPESKNQLGRSVYAGSNSSFYQPTLYQKGIQLGDGLPENYLRLEHRYSPSKAQEKAELAAISPVMMLGLRPVSRDLTLAICQLATAPYKLTRYPKERSPYFWMLTQYRDTLHEMRNDHGSWAAVGEQIGLDLEGLAQPH